MIHVITNIERPRKDLIDEFRGMSAATVHEASGRKGSVDCGIKPIAKECVFVDPLSRFNAIRGIT